MDKIKVGIIGPGNIGQDLMIKVKKSPLLELACVVGIAESPGIARARELGADASAGGVRHLVKEHQGKIQIVFDATSAKGHIENAPLLREAGMFSLDLTPAALGPYCVPAVNLDERMLQEPDVNMVTCAGQATAPMVAAINRVADVYYAETVSSLSSFSAGPGTRSNIDEFTQTTRSALEQVGGADRARALIILNPAQPPITMSNTIYCKVRNLNMQAIEQAADECLATMQRYVPGCRFRMRPIAKEEGDDVVMMILEVVGAGDFLPPTAGNLDIINAASIRIAEAKARQLLEGKYGGNREWASEAADRVDKPIGAFHRRAEG